MTALCQRCNFKHKLYGRSATMDIPSANLQAHENSFGELANCNETDFLGHNAIPRKNTTKEMPVDNSGGKNHKNNNTHCWKYMYMYIFHLHVPVKHTDLTFLNIRSFVNLFQRKFSRSVSRSRSKQRTNLDHEVLSRPSAWNVITSPFPL